jgi:hypothetical protein
MDGELPATRIVYGGICMRGGSATDIYSLAGMWGVIMAVGGKCMKEGSIRMVTCTDRESGSIVMVVK